MKKIVSVLSGGLGNQMFQYAAAMAVSKRLNRPLVIDDWSGFVRDFEYRRQFELGALSITARKATPWERVPIWLYRLRHRKSLSQNAFHERYWFGEFLNETKLAYQMEIETTPVYDSTWMVGYWQSPRYFEKYAADVNKELSPVLPDNKTFRSLGQEMRTSESVAVGIRLYEESSDPGVHARFGIKKSALDIKMALERLSLLIPNKKIYLFRSHRSEVLNELGLPDSCTYVIPEEGFIDPVACLWLMTQCKHHIITNSSYYWWGAWLSSFSFEGDKQCIIAADNFINKDCLVKGWLTF